QRAVIARPAVAPAKQRALNRRRISFMDDQLHAGHTQRLESLSAAASEIGGNGHRSNADRVSRSGDTGHTAVAVEAQTGAGADSPTAKPKASETSQSFGTEERRPMASAPARMKHAEECGAQVTPSIVLERTATKREHHSSSEENGGGRKDLLHQGLAIDYGRLLRPDVSDSASVQSLRWSKSLPQAGHAPRRRSWSVSGADERSAGADSPPSGARTPTKGKHGSTVPPVAAASATPTHAAIKSILVRGPPSRRPSLNTIGGGGGGGAGSTTVSSLATSPRPSLSQRPQSLFAPPQVGDDAQAKFLKVSDGLTFRYHPNNPLGGPGRFGRVYLGVNIDDPSDLVAIKFPHGTEEESLKTMRRAGLFGHRKGHEARALRCMGMLRGEVPLGDGRKALVMDYVAGLEPRELIDQGLINSETALKKLAGKTRRAVTQQIHRRGVAHGDVHAGNIRFRVEPKVTWWQRILCGCPLPGPLGKLFGGRNEDDMTRTFSTNSGGDSDGLMGFGFPLTPATTQDGSPGLGLSRFSTLSSFRTMMGGRRSSGGGGFGPAGTIEPGDAHAQNPDAAGAIQYKLTPQFIDFGMARFLNELSQSEAAHAVESDRQRAYDAVWTQRHRLARSQRAAVPAAMLSVAGHSRAPAATTTGAQVPGQTSGDGLAIRRLR
ncbi:hypothetical protein THASP1DRAFT_25482, partial [Thamnocephalis sphaerospora]